MKFTLLIVLIIPFLSVCQRNTQQTYIHGTTLLENLTFKGQERINYNWRYSYGENESIGFCHLDKQLIVHHLNDTIVDNYPFPEGLNSPFYNVTLYKNQYYLYSNDGFLYQLHKDKNAELISKIHTDQLNKKDGLMLENLLTMETRFHFLNDSIVILPVKWDLYGQKGKYANTKKPCPIFIKYNINSDQYHLCDIWSKPLKEIASYTSRFSPYSELVEGILYVSNPYSSLITLKDLNRNEDRGVKSIKSQFHIDSILPIEKKVRHDINEKDRYLVEKAYYGPLVYNKYRNEFYRIFYHALPRKLKNGDFSIYTDKSSSVLIYNKNLNISEEIFLGNDYFHIMGISPTKNGFLLNNYTGINLKEENYITSINLNRKQ